MIRKVLGDRHGWQGQVNVECVSPVTGADERLGCTLCKDCSFDIFFMATTQLRLAVVSIVCFSPDFMPAPESPRWCWQRHDVSRLRQHSSSDTAFKSMRCSERTETIRAFNSCDHELSNYLGLVNAFVNPVLPNKRLDSLVARAFVVSSGSSQRRT